MKTQSTTLLAQLSKKEINTLTTQVAETISFTHVAKKIFTAANLWNIQKQRRTTSIRNFA